MKCPRCQHENRPGAKFCEECAASLARACVNCGAEFSATAKFCSECAHPVGPAAPPAPQRLGTPETYIPKHLAERIINSKAALEGERKQVTVLFADMKGSMELLADRDPEEARKLLDPVLELMMEAVHRYDGIVNQVMGDGIMALFGAPLALEDHAVRACYAALRMQDSLKRYTDDMRRAHGVEVQIRVGLNSGEVVVRSVGSDLRMDYTAVGQTTHLAARMEQLAMPGTVRLTGDTLRLAEGYVEVRSLGPIPVKGLPDPIEIFELTAAGQARTRLQAAALRGLTRFVGRDAEIGLLRQALDQAGEGRGQVVAVVGEPGVGKSRLFYEFVHSHRTHGWLVLQSASASHGKAAAYLPVIDLLRSYFRIDRWDDSRAIRAKVMGTLLTLDPSLDDAVPPILAVLDALPPESPFLRLEPAQRRQLTLGAVKRLLLRESRVQPLLLVLEDLHWIDSETQTVLDGLVESLPSAAILLAMNYRPEYSHPWGNKTYYRQVRIDPLPPESADELLQHLVGTDPDLEPLKTFLIERTEGNPFFLEEGVRTLVETGTLAGERGAYRLTRAVSNLQVPASVQTLLAARIDRLGSEDKQLLQAAAVVGKDVPVILLQGASDLDETGVARGLVRLQAAEFLYETSLFPEVEYTFKHALTHDVVYRSLLKEQQRRLHARVVRAMEEHYAGRLGDHVEQLVRHAVHGELWEQAAEYGQAAGKRSMARSAYREAVQHFEQALGCITHLAETSDTLARAIDIRVNLRGALIPIGESTRGLEWLLEADVLARRLREPRRLAWLATLLTHHLWLEGRTAEARRYSDAAIEQAEALGDVELATAAYSLVANALLRWGEFDRVETYARRVFELLAGDYTRPPGEVMVNPAVTAHYALSTAAAERGEFDEAVRLGEANVRIASDLRHPFSLVHAVLYLAWIHMLRGTLATAAALCERGLTISREAEITFLRPRLSALLGYVQAVSGDADAGVVTLRAAVEAQRAMGFRSQSGPVMSLLSEGLLAAGRLDEAEEQAHRAMALAIEGAEPASQARVHRLLGEIATLREPPVPTVAKQHYQEALGLIEPRGMRPLIAHCHVGLGRLNRRTGKRERAREHLTTATAMYRGMAMTYWLEKAEAELEMLK